MGKGWISYLVLRIAYCVLRIAYCARIGFVLALFFGVGWSEILG